MDNVLIERLNSRLEETGRTARDVSLKATEGRNPDAVRNILRGAVRKPPADVLEGIAAELDTTAAWLIGRTDNPQRAESPLKPADVHVPPRESLPADVPVRGTAAASHLKGAFQLEPGANIDWVRRPPGLAKAADAYALYVEGSSMEPRYLPGDLIFIHPHRPPRQGDMVIVQMAVAPDEIEASIGYLRRRTAEYIFLGKLNPEAEVRLNRGQVIAIHRVMSTNELFGV